MSTRWTVIRWNSEQYFWVAEAILRSKDSKDAPSLWLLELSYNVSFDEDLADQLTTYELEMIAREFPEQNIYGCGYRAKPPMN